MVVNNGFLMRSDRFSLTEEGLYLLRGHLVPDTVLTVTLDGEPFPARVEKQTDNVDERYGGAETVVYVDLSGVAILRGKLKLYSEGRKGRHLAFEITAKELVEKKRPIKLFIDECVPVKGEGCLRVTGWAAAKDPVEIAVLDENKKRIDCRVKRYERPDVSEIFDEYEIEKKCGFTTEIRPVPKKRIYLALRAGGERMLKELRTDAISAMTEKAGHFVQRGTQYLKYYGAGAVVRKVREKFFNPAARPINYGAWISKHLPNKKVLAMQREEVFDPAPLFSICVPLYRTPEEYLREMVASVREQTYANWELLLSDGSGQPDPKDEKPFDRKAFSALLDEIEASDPRIRVVRNDGKQLRIAENTNAAMAAATGDYIGFLDHDDILAPHALYENADALRKYPDAEMLYSDEDKVDEARHHMQPNMKPDYAPDFLCSVNYICHFLVVKRELAERVGNFSSAYDGAQDYDFILRCTEATTPEQIVHIPKILYFWRFFEGSTSANPESKLYAFEAGERAINDHYQRLGLPATAEMGQYPGIYRTRWHWEEQPRLTVLIPNKDHIQDLDKCLQSIFRREKYPNYEILIVENNSTEPETFEYYEKLKAEHDHVKVVTYEGSFNYAAINNFGAKFTDAPYLLLLNNDTELMVDDAFEEMLGYCMRPDVGAVGARLYYEDNTIQHAGVVVGWGGIAGHAFVNQLRSVSGYQHRIILQQNYSAVTAACMMVRRDVFDEVGGFYEGLAVAFNDIDLCMKIRKAGYLIVYNPFAELHHYESKSRGLDQGDPEKVRRFQGEMAEFQKRWPEILRDGDPYYNPNLSMVTQDFSLKKL